MLPFVFSRFYSFWKVCGVENSLDELVFYFQGISPKFGHAAFRDGNDTSLRMASAREVSFFELSKIRSRGLQNSFLGLLKFVFAAGNSFFYWPNTFWQLPKFVRETIEIRSAAY